MPSLRAQKNQIESNRNLPICRIHKGAMIFVPARARWECPVMDCKSAAYPNVEEDGRPIIGKGETELLIHTDRDGKTYTYLRATGNNVMILIDDLLIDKYYQGKDRAPAVKLLLSSEVVIDEYGRRK